jgi:hypothetical protein
MLQNVSTKASVRLHRSRLIDRRCASHDFPFGVSEAQAAGLKYLLEDVGSAAWDRLASERSSAR